MNAKRSSADQVRARLRRVGLDLVCWAVNHRGQRRAIGRSYLFDALARVTPSVAIDSDGLRVYLDTADRVVSRRIFANGLWERAMFEQLLPMLAERGLGGLEGKLFHEIGANIGTASCQAVSIWGAERSWAFEPSPQNVRLLRQNVTANNLEEHIMVHPYALSDKDGSVALELSEVNSGDHRVRTATTSSGSGYFREATRTTTDVHARRLDGFVEDGTLDLDSVGLAWIDVQGHEGHVFGGARALLSSHTPIVCEFWPYGLRRAGGLQRFQDELAGHRSTFIDLSSPARGVQSIRALAPLTEELDSAVFDQTDLLLLP